LFRPVRPAFRPELLGSVTKPVQKFVYDLATARAPLREHPGMPGARKFLTPEYIEIAWNA